MFSVTSKLASLRLIDMGEGVSDVSYMKRRNSKVGHMCIAIQW